MKVTFNTNNNSFSLNLNKEITGYFSKTGYKMTGNSWLYLKTAILLTTFIAIYILLLTVSMPAWLSILLCMLLGITTACIGFNIMHDAGHGSFSHKGWINEMMSYTLNLVGGNIFIWKEKHNINHHSYTNIEGLDDDIDIQPFIRTNKGQPWRWYHRYQHIYAPVMYSVGYLFWIFSQDFQKYFTGKVAGRKMRRMDRKEHLIFWFSKLAYVVSFIVIPVAVLGWKAIIGYLVFAITCGFFISIVFQLAHLVEDTDFPDIVSKEEHSIENHWAIHQVVTTANFCTQSKFLTMLLGGLNFQVEHHLFPRISHVHYPELSKRIKGVCGQFNVPYNEYPGIIHAIRSHFSYLKRVGANP
jgi:linoleoyl-CoA desaturase